MVDGGIIFRLILTTPLIMREVELRLEETVPVVESESPAQAPPSRKLLNSFLNKIKNIFEDDVE